MTIAQQKCSVYDVCGGCSFQHLHTHDYENFKITDFKKTFEALNLQDNIYQPPVFIPSQTRRRTTISFYNDGTDFVWGYKQAKSHKIISASDCIVVTPKILNALSSLAEFIKPLTKPEVQIKASVTEALNGLDISLRGIKAPKPKEASEFNQAFFKLIPDAIRLTIDTHIVGQSETPYIQVADFNIPLPLDVFLQPSTQGQEILIQNVLKHLGKVTKKTKIIDLFSGLGTFSLPLSQLCSVAAYDSAEDAIKTLIETKESYGLGSRINAKPRDLFRDPVSFLELNNFDIAVIDPPRVGAEAQTKQLAKSNLKKIIYIFCDTQTAKRDLLILQKAGYTLQSLTMIDQFIYSNHTEGMALLLK